MLLHRKLTIVLFWNQCPRKKREGVLHSGRSHAFPLQIRNISIPYARSHQSGVPAHSVSQCDIRRGIIAHGPDFQVLLCNFGWTLREEFGKGGLAREGGRFPNRCRAQSPPFVHCLFPPVFFERIIRSGSRRSRRLIEGLQTQSIRTLRQSWVPRQTRVDQIGIGKPNFYLLICILVLYQHPRPAGVSVREQHVQAQLQRFAQVFRVLENQYGFHRIVDVVHLYGIFLPPSGKQRRMPSSVLADSLRFGDAVCTCHLPAMFAHDQNAAVLQPRHDLRSQRRVG
mmetsp:Transcript_54153/g.115064  ORF Transcript_54153/g.115064 Transcript_54153/m.115064 type:complete len:283 (+) Transcript_54153:9-857(+)